MLGASGMAAVGPVFFALVLFLGSATDGGEGLSFFPVPDAEKEGKSSFWFDQGMSDIEARLKLQHSTGLAKRVVIFLGDGMGLSTVTAARIYKGQKQRKASGEESALAWDAFPHVSLSRTYGLNVQTSDSANTATAYLCGVKANYETLGVDSRIRREPGWSMARVKWAPRQEPPPLLLRMPPQLLARLTRTSPPGFLLECL